MLIADWVYFITVKTAINDLHTLIVEMKPIMNLNKSQNWLVILLIINIICTILHYMDNFLFFDRYPASNWMNMHHVYIAWLLLTPFAFIGYLLYKKQKYWLAYLSPFIYSNAGAGSMAQLVICLGK